MGSTQEMATLLAKRDARIRELEIENMELKSKLDKYQMIFSGNISLPLYVDWYLGLISCLNLSIGPNLFSFILAEGSPAAVGPVTPVRADKNRVRRTNRGVGISAEPQSLKTLQELTTKTFPEIKKEER